MDHALAEVEFLAEKRTFDLAAQRFAEFRSMFEKHLQFEETVEFPEFERRTKDVQQVLPLIHSQHLRLVAALQYVGEALTKRDFTAFCSGLRDLNELLKEHQSTEERLMPREPT